MNLYKAQHITSISKDKHFGFPANILLPSAFFAEAHSKTWPDLKESLWLGWTIGTCVQGTCSHRTRLYCIRTASGSSSLMFAFVNDQEDVHKSFKVTLEYRVSCQ